MDATRKTRIGVATLVAALLATAAPLAPLHAQDGTVAPGDKLDQMFGDAPEATAAPDGAPTGPGAGPAKARPATQNGSMAPPGGFGQSTQGALPPAMQGKRQAAPAMGSPYPPKRVKAPTPAAAPQTLQEMMRQGQPPATATPIAAPVPTAPRPAMPDPAPAPSPTTYAPPAGPTEADLGKPRVKQPSASEIGDLDANDKMTAEDVVKANRRIHMLEARDKAAKLQLQLIKTEADIKAARDEADPPAPAATLPPPMPVAALPPPVPSSPIPSIDAPKKVEPQVDVAKRFQTVSITGPQDRLQAMLKVRNFGYLTVHQGDSLPADYKVVAVQSKGVSVRKGTERPVMVPFTQ